MARASYITGVVFLAAVCASACTNSSIAPAPVVNTPTAGVTPTAASFTLSGVVVEQTKDGPRPIAGVQVGLYAWNEDALTPEALVTSTVTDADGRYTLKAVRQVWWIGATKAGYQYFAEQVSLLGDEVYDIHLIPAS